MGIHRLLYVPVELLESAICAVVQVPKEERVIGVRIAFEALVSLQLLEMQFSDQLHGFLVSLTLVSLTML